MSNEITEGPVGIYAGLIARRVEGIHRVVVANITKLLEWDRSAVVRDAFDRGGVMHVATHVVLEGNHRSAAYALLGEPVPCTVLEDDTDLEVCKEFAEVGGMSRFVHNGEDLELLVREALQHAAYEYHGPTSARDLVRRCLEDETFSVENWPAYIRRHIVA